MADEQAICTVIKEQFAAEVVYKESELQRIDDRIQLAKMMLHRLRLGILAQQYGLSGFYLTEDYSKENIGVQFSWNSFESDFLNSQRQEEEHKNDGEEVGSSEEKREAGEKGLLGDKREGYTPEIESTTPVGESSIQSSQVPSEVSEEETADTRQLPELAVGRKVSSLLNDLRKHSPGSHSIASSASSTAVGAGSSTGVEGRGGSIVCEDPLPASSSPASLSRFPTKKRVIVGNTSQFQDPSARSTIDGSTHKWMVYVRGPGMHADISSFVKAVRFFLHPSYHPNDIIRVSKPPFHLTRYGWGEFPVRVQLEFTDKVNKHVDIIHNLVLDRTHTGHQTLGSETVVDLDLVTTEALSPSVSGDDRVGPRNISVAHPFGAPSHSSEKKHKSGREPEATAPEGEMDSRHIHHVFLPATSTVDQVLLDHSYSQIVVVSRRSRPLQLTTADEEAMGTCDLNTRITLQSGVETGHETPLDDLLHSIVKTVPLCGPESSGFHLVAPSIEVFKKWNIGRRRASEWMRAVAMKRVTRSLEPPVPQASSLATKQVMEWCRRNGYTPLDPVPQSSRGFCKYCGCQLPTCWEETEQRERISHPQCADKMEVQLEEEDRRGEGRGEGYSDSDSESMQEEEEERGDGQRAIQRATTARIGQCFSTLSDPFRLFESLASKARKLRVLQEQQARDQVVDVLSVPSQRHQVVEPVPRFRVPQTPELKWVQRTAAAIGIRIYPAVIDQMYAHVVEHMIYMACTKFARVIMDRAVTESAQEVEGDSNDERCIVPLHIYRAVEGLDCCDFLTNAYMGVPLADHDSPAANNKPPSTTDRDRTFRDE
jgi:hypothetical protein